MMQFLPQCNISHGDPQNQTRHRRQSARPRTGRRRRGNRARTSNSRSIPTPPSSIARSTQLHELPPLVTSWEILSLKNLLAEAAEGRRFLLQGGDCAESFDDCTSPLISNRLKVMLQMSLVLVHGLKLPIVRVGRFAGQYAKPRSADIETRGDISLPSYRGDLVNAPAFTRRSAPRPIRSA